ncbi:MAG: hypothetical protein QGH53_03415 [Prochlorococcaceae cyanobacterium ETNP18_MAG_1]|nr:hypothetical protein [Prochlorococcaceae cyanobacterium ETNP18_MAG_1]
MIDSADHLKKQEPAKEQIYNQKARASDSKQSGHDHLQGTASAAKQNILKTIMPRK